jgi:hypothetical protein
LKNDGFAVFGDASSIPWVPDIIQANQTYPLIEAFALFPDVPVLSIYYDATIWFNKSFELPSIRKYGQLVLLAEVASLSDFHTSQMKLNCCITPWIWTRSVPGLRFQFVHVAPPLRGEWFAGDCVNKAPDAAHRRAVLVDDGHGKDPKIRTTVIFATISRSSASRRAK